LEVVEAATTNKKKLTIADCKKLLKEVVDGDVYTLVEKNTMKYIRENYKFENDADQWIRRSIASWAAKKAKKDASDSSSTSNTSSSSSSEEEKLHCFCNLPAAGRLLIGCDAQLVGCENWYHVDCVNIEENKIPAVWFCPSCKAKPVNPKDDKEKTSSYYKQIDGQKYDKGMIEAADLSVQGKGDGRISEKDAKIIFMEAVDGNKITDIEYKTLDYIRKNYKWTSKGEEWIENAIKLWQEDHPQKKKRNVKKKDKKKKDESENDSKAKKGRKKAKKATNDSQPVAMSPSSPAAGSDADIKDD